MQNLKKNSVISSLLVFFVFVFGLTGPITVLAATAPSLGDAASFSVLGAAAMSSANPTTISGDLGLSPGLAVSKTGTWTHTGGNDYFGTGGLSASAETAALGAYNNLVSQTTTGSWGTNPWSPVPGVWTDTSSPVFTGTITLNGDYSDVWVFKISTDFTFSGSVVLAGNAQACNVFWTVAGDATIGSGSHFVGTLIAQNDITSASGATINGRLISLSGTTIAMNGTASTISGPTCAVAPVVVSTPTGTKYNTLTVVKQIINDNGGIAKYPNFPLFVNGNPVTSGQSVALVDGVYTVTETN
ncbi:MAG: ice-binding family protein, partial [Candidatus Magasanikbacteria bacterium]|nr:ice-binding family protein [Candidatus Magasanikbacteria bacterium]